MTSKKLLNDPASCVSEAVEGIILTQSRDRIRRLGSLNVLYRPRSKESMDSEVALISGGGSGHEPAHWVSLSLFLSLSLSLSLST
jgi:triose/dihydroxyacetone kinase / FAD-AMP lyase (cyclizing)